jgi:putative oxidoreductase
MFDWFTRAAVPLILRFGLAAIFIYHGWDKVTGEGHQGGWAWANQMPGAPPAPAQAAVAYGELAGGLAMAAGLLTRLAAIGLAFIMGGAIATVTGANGFNVLNHGYEYNFAILIICAAVLLTGAGPWSVDRLLRFRRKYGAAPAAR